MKAELRRINAEERGGIKVQNLELTKLSVEGRVGAAKPWQPTPWKIFINRNDKPDAKAEKQS